ncbi:energy transducer TonB [Hymenobacter sp. BT683]|uniref:Energy transducer TonB n=2 Tax=Hymenobacter jeongseonensis TaxID=2791027 RepID=A0ABS0IKX0_9BACT|nr:energy transducer TonB [Hymenobacter jeongseonensis]
MTNSQLATASLDDIVFDGRNRHYGAYQLRAAYQRHVSRALVIATAVFALLIAVPVVARMLEDKAPAVLPKAPAVNELIAPPLGPDVVTPPEPAAAKPPVQPPRPATIKDLVPVVVKEKDAPAESEVPERNQLLEKASGFVTTEGDPNAAPDAGPVDLEPGLGKGPAADIVKERIYVSVEQMPELPGGGGTTAIVAAIQRAVKYPSLALRNGVEGRVFVSFTVNPKGEVVNVAIVKGLGSGLDEETMRAINSLPRFIPGKQNGREVSVSFTVPVTYKIQ